MYVQVETHKVRTNKLNVEGEIEGAVAVVEIVSYMKYTSKQ